MQTVFEWVTVGVSWLVIVAGGLAVAAGLLYLMNDVLITRIFNETKTLAIMFDFWKNREDFRKYQADRGAWEEKRIKAYGDWRGDGENRVAYHPTNRHCTDE